MCACIGTCLLVYIGFGHASVRTCSFRYANPEGVKPTNIWYISRTKLDVLNTPAVDRGLLLKMQTADELASLDPKYLCTRIGLDNMSTRGKGSEFDIMKPIR